MHHQNLKKKKQKCENEVIKFDNRKSHSGLKKKIIIKVL